MVDRDDNSSQAGPRPSIGLVGLGRQGGQIAGMWLDAGYRLFVFDTDPEAVASFAARGAIAMRSPAAVAAEAALTGVCVVDDDQTRAVVSGRGGVIEAAPVGAMVAVHSTVSPALVAELHRALEPRGIILLDIPVSGGGGAVDRGLNFIIGGPTAAAQACAQLYAGIGGKVSLAGAAGNAMKVKLAHQMILCANIAATAEARRWCAAQGIAAEVMTAAVHQGVGQSAACDLFDAIAAAPAAADLFEKDLDLAAAASAGLELPLLRLTRRCIRDDLGTR